MHRKELNVLDIHWISVDITSLINKLDPARDMILALFFSHKIRSPDGQHDVGKIKKEYAGFAKEAFTDADKFCVSCEYIHDLKWEIPGIPPTIRI